MGSFQQLSQATAAHFEGDTKKAVGHIMDFLLNNQYVSSKEFPDRLWQCQRGTGIGLCHSGEVADLCFYNLVEKPIFNHGLSMFGISGWWRYRDDTLILHDSSFNLDGLVDFMLKRCKIWKLECEATHCKTIHYLDVRLSLDEDKFRIAPEYKPTGLKRILCSASAHVPNIHRAWRLMMLRNMKFRCLNVDVNFHRDILLDRFAEAGMSGAILCWLQQFLNSHAPKRASRACANNTSSTWCILPFHPVWHRALCKAIRKLNSSHKHLLAMAHSSWSRTEVNPSWTNVLPNVNALVSQATAQLAVGE